MREREKVEGRWVKNERRECTRLCSSKGGCQSGCERLRGCESDGCCRHGKCLVAFKVRSEETLGETFLGRARHDTVAVLHYMHVMPMYCTACTLRRQRSVAVSLDRIGVFPDLANANAFLFGASSAGIFLDWMSNALVKDHSSPRRRTFAGNATQKRGVARGGTRTRTPRTYGPGCTRRTNIEEEVLSLCTPGTL